LRVLVFAALATFIAASTTSFAAAQELPGILVTRQLARMEHLAVGDAVELSRNRDGSAPRRFRVVGIYEPTPDPMRLGSTPLDVRLHLPDLLTFFGEQPGAYHVSAINIGLNDPADRAAFVREVNSRVPGVRARPAEGAAALGGTFVVLERFHFAIAAVTIAAATVFLLALTIMLVDERRETVGVLRLIGMPVRRILGQVLIEGVLLAGGGALFGLALALASESLINHFFQWRYDTALVFVRITPRVAALCLAIAVPLGAVATVAASWALLRRSALGLARR
jgi:ABC-type lipoprotein release transport system permease subunit